MSVRDGRVAVGTQVKTVGKVLIVMGILMFMLAPLFRDADARSAISKVDHAIAPAQRSFLYRVSHPAPDGATFCYACALLLEMAGVPLTFTGHFWRSKRREDAPLMKGTVI